MKRNKMLWFQCAFFLVVICVVYFGVVQSDTSSKNESKQQLEKALQNALTQCYSVEGEYPESLQYLQEHYAIYIDEGKYTLHYIYEGANIRPEIIIMRKDSAYEK